MPHACDKKAVAYYVSLIVFVCLFVGYVLLYIFVFSQPAVACEKDIVNCVFGRVIYDSSYSANQNLVLSVFINRAVNIFGNTVDARGLVTAIAKDHCIITSGEYVALYGYFSDSMFICSEIMVLDKPSVCHLRQFLIQLIEKRILGASESQADLLGCALLLGRAEDSSLSVKSLAQMCGCTHILALSGMHLNVFASVCTLVFGKKKFGKCLSSIPVTLFVFIAGPRPSLIRSLLMFYFNFLHPEQRLLAAFCVQLLLFPITMINVGAIYGYAAVFALIYLAPYIKELIRPDFGIVTSYSATLLIAPVSYVLSAQWHWITIFISPLCSLLITLSMVFSLFTLVLSNLPLLSWVKSLTYRLLESALLYFSRIPPCQGGLWLLYVPLFVAICLRVLSKQAILHGGGAINSLKNIEKASRRPIYDDK